VIPNTEFLYSVASRKAITLTNIKHITEGLQQSTDMGCKAIHSTEHKNDAMQPAS
jgi:hypothetical protein